MTMIAANLQPVRTRIATAGPADGRNVQDVALLAVPKTFGPEAVRAAWLVAFAACTQARWSSPSLLLLLELLALFTCGPEPFLTR
jgi:uncharacterized pyridoxal phosphate-containing UPF0001 family protein